MTRYDLPNAMDQREDWQKLVKKKALSALEQMTTFSHINLNSTKTIKQ